MLPLASAREVVQAMLCLKRDKQKLVIRLCGLGGWKETRPMQEEEGRLLRKLLVGLWSSHLKFSSSKRGIEGGISARN